MKVKIRYPNNTTAIITCDDAHEPYADELGQSVDLVINGEIETIHGIESMEVIKNG